MRIYIISLILLLSGHQMMAQTKGKITAPQVPCNGSADDVPGIYTDHNNGKYGRVILKGTAVEKAAMMKNLIAIEKLEEASRKGFKLTGSAARVSFARYDNSNYGKNIYARHGYQLGVYAYVCHVTEHVPKIVDEYKTVFRVDINPYLSPVGVKPVGTGEFSMKYGNPRYDIADDVTSKYPNPISKYFSEEVLLAGRSDDYKNKHADFLKLNNGNGYVENWQAGNRYDNHGPNSYQWIDRHYFITKPGVPLLIPVSRKQYLEDMLVYLELEKANFELLNSKQLSEIATQTAEWAKKKRDALESDKLAYPKFYEVKKAKLKDLLTKQKNEWLQKPAVVDQNTQLKESEKILEALGRFYDEEAEYKSALYVLNPAYFISNNGQSAKTLFLEVQFRYEINKDRGFSARLFNNWEKNFAMDVLKKMAE